MFITSVTTPTYCKHYLASIVPQEVVYCYFNCDKKGSSTKHDRQTGIILKSEGCSFRDVAKKAKLLVSRPTFCYTIKRQMANGENSDRKSSGRPKAWKNNVLELLESQVQLQAQLNTGGSKQVSLSTREDSELHVWVAVRKPKKNRRPWGTWKKVLWTDESSEIFDSSCKVFVWHQGLKEWFLRVWHRMSNIEKEGQSKKHHEPKQLPQHFVVPCKSHWYLSSWSGVHPTARYWPKHTSRLC